MFGGCVGEAVAELFVDVPLDGGYLFLLVWFGGVELAPSGLSWKVGLFICWEMVD